MISLDDQIKEIKRELSMREQFYPNWIATGKIKRDAANRQYLRMQAALKSLERLKQKAVQQDLFQNQSHEKNT